MKLRALLVVIALAAGGAARGDSSVPQPRPGAPSPADRAAARELYKEAVQLYDARRFGEAATRFERALALADEPAVLFNIGQARRLNGERDAALAAYRAYLRRTPNARSREMVERLIADLEHPPADGGTH